MKLITRRARRSAPALPSTKDLKIAAIDFVSEARQNPLSALPAVGAAGAAGLVLFAAASTLTAPPVAEGGVYKGVGVGTDGIVRIGFPAGGEVLVPGAPFQEKNGYLGMWNWEKQVKPVPKDQTPEAQKALRAAFDAERKKFDVEAQQQGFKSAEARGRRLSFYEASPASPPSYAGPRHRREGENPRREGCGESGEGGRQGREGGRGREGGGGGQVRDAGEAGLLRQHQGHRAAVDVRRRRAEEVDSPPKVV